MWSAPGDFPKAPGKPHPVTTAATRCRRFSGEYVDILGFDSAQLAARREYCAQLALELAPFCRRMLQSGSSPERVLDDVGERLARDKGWDLCAAEVSWVLQGLRTVLT